MDVLVPKRYLFWICYHYIFAEQLVLRRTSPYMVACMDVRGAARLYNSLRLASGKSVGFSFKYVNFRRHQELEIAFQLVQSPVRIWIIYEHAESDLLNRMTFDGIWYNWYFPDEGNLSPRDAI